MNLLPYCYWPIDLGGFAGLPTWWDWINQTTGESVAHDRGDDITALDLELVRAAYEVLVELADCAICGAPMDPAVDVKLALGSLVVGRIVVTTHCHGSSRHGQVAEVVDCDGDLRLGDFTACSAPRRWATGTLLRCLLKSR